MLFWPTGAVQVKPPRCAECFGVGLGDISFPVGRCQVQQDAEVLKLKERVSVCAPGDVARFLCLQPGGSNY